MFSRDCLFLAQSESTCTHSSLNIPHYRCTHFASEVSTKMRIFNEMEWRTIGPQDRTRHHMNWLSQEEQCSKSWTPTGSPLILRLLCSDPCCFLALIHSILDLSTTRFSPSLRLFSSFSNVAFANLEIRRLNLELTLVRHSTLCHQFPPSHLHFLLPSSPSEEDPLFRLFSSDFLDSPCDPSILSTNSHPMSYSSV